MRNVKDMKDVQIVLNELLDWKQLLETKANDMHGLQIKNLGEPTAATDAINYEKTQELIRMVKVELQGQIKEIELSLQKIKAALSSLGYPIR